MEGRHTHCFADSRNPTGAKHMDNNTTILIAVAIAAVAIVIIAALASRRRARLRSAELRENFGPEYDRAVVELGSTKHAERELAARERRVQQFHFHELNAADRARFSTRWTQI